MTGKLKGAAVLFDLDGTLIDTAGDLADAMNVALMAAGHAQVEGSAVRSLVGHGARRMLMRGFELSTGRPGTEDELDAGLACFLDYYEANIAVQSRPFAGAVEIIETLRRDGAAVAICTNKREHLACRLIDALGLQDLFDVIAGADTAAAAKPDPAPVYYCMEKTGAGRGVFIGDSDTDIRAAAAAEIPCYIADFGYGPLTLKDEACATFSSYEALAPEILKVLTGCQ